MDNKIHKIKRSNGKCRRNSRIFGGTVIIFSIMLCLFIGFKYSSNKKVQASKKSTTNTVAANKSSEVDKKTLKDKTIASKEESNLNVKESKNSNANNNANSNNSTSNTLKDKENISVFADKVFHKDGQKVAFLTFDDGPTRNITPKILDTLKQYDVKATFFVLGQLAEQNGDLLKREYEEGHSIANHSYTHEYKTVYRDVSSFMKEVDTTNKIIENRVGDGFKSELFRFPGGSFEKKKNPFKQKLKSEGIRYIDWNVSSGDAAGHNVPVENILNNIKTTSAGKEHLVILMHDAGTKKTTAEALPKIIEYLKSQGFVFKTLK